jgi:hypothetical protein
MGPEPLQIWNCGWFREPPTDPNSPCPGIAARSDAAAQPIWLAVHGNPPSARRLGVG